jgi:hypothetical protein
MKTKYVLCAMLACIASAVALGQQVCVNYNRSQDFAKYHTYAWAGNNANQIQPRYCRNKPNRISIRHSMATQSSTTQPSARVAMLEHPG